MLSYALAIVIGVTGVIATIVGLRRQRPVLTCIAASTLGYYAVSPVLIWHNRPVAKELPTLEATQALCLAWFIVFLWAYRYFILRAQRKQEFQDSQSISPHKLPPADDSTLLLASTLLACVGFVAGLTFAALGGGGGWARDRANDVVATGFLTTLSYSSFLFPQLVWCLWMLRSKSVTLVHIFCAALLFTWLMGTMLFSSLTAEPLIMMIPFAIMWVFHRPGSIAVIRFGIVIVMGLGATWFLRLMRLFGSLSRGGQFRIRMSDAIDLFGSSGLHPADSFGEFYFLARMVGYVADGGPLLLGRSYLCAVAQFIPGILWDGKAAFIRDGRTDFFVRKVLFRDDVGSIPIGVVGEALVNFGFIGVFASAIVIALAAAAADARFLRTLFGFRGSIAVVLITPLFMYQPRGSIVWASATFTPLLLLTGLVWALRRLYRARGTDEDLTPLHWRETSQGSTARQ
jgi:hypothetical protein